MKKKINNFIKTLWLNAYDVADVWENVDFSKLEELHHNGFYEMILPNIPQVTERIKKSNVLGKGKNWIVLETANVDNTEAHNEQCDILEYLRNNTKKGVPCIISEGVCIDDYR